MEFRSAFNRFKSDKWAVGSFLFILGITLIAIFAYPLSPDKTAYANQMHLSIHSQPPGFTCQVLIIPQKERQERRSFFFGNLNSAEEIPIQNIRWFDDSFRQRCSVIASPQHQSPPGSTAKKPWRRQQ